VPEQLDMRRAYWAAHFFLEIWIEEHGSELPQSSFLIILFTGSTPDEEDGTSRDPAFWEDWQQTYTAFSLGEVLSINLAFNCFVKFILDQADRFQYQELILFHDSVMDRHSQSLLFWRDALDRSEQMAAE
jgi:hypothetical protein